MTSTVVSMAPYRSICRGSRAQQEEAVSRLAPYLDQLSNLLKGVLTHCSRGKSTALRTGSAVGQ